MIWKLTSFGDTGLLLPLSLLVLLSLLAQRQVATAGALLAALATCAILTLGSKLGFHMCGDGVESLDIRSPSGHTSVSLTFYGSLGVLIASGRPIWQKAVIALIAAPLAVGIGLTRWVLHVHTAEEVLLGYCIGLGCVALFAALVARAGWPRVNLVWLAACFALALGVFGGIRVNFENEIAAVARRLSHVSDICP